MIKLRSKKSFHIFVAGSLALSVAGCGTSEDLVTKENVGLVVGGILGGVLGSQIGGGTGRIVAGVAGTVIGGLLGRELGRRLSRSDQVAATKAQDQAHTAPVGQTVSWSNPETGNAGSVTPVAETRNANGQRCRDYRGAIVVDGRQEQASGIACEQPDGTWKFAGN